ncbi:MAG: response regulator transcription factor [Rhodocyclaceae bacterium]|nr:response regulator transcription factor [Rhodocyclaceae bacterium]
METIVIVEDKERLATAIKRALSAFSFGGVTIKDNLDDLRLPLQSDFDEEQIIILQVEFGKGAEIIESLRWDMQLLAPVILLSLEKRERLKKKYPIVQEVVPGSYFIKFPFRLNELKEVIESAKGLPSEQLKDVVRKYYHIEDSLRIVLHDMINAVGSNTNEAKELFRRLKRGLAFLPDRVDKEKIERVDKIFSEKINNAEELRGLLFDIQGELKTSQEELTGTEEKVTVFNEPPKEYEYILIVDDDGYDQGSMKRLMNIGYGVDLACSYEEAICRLEYDPPDVLLCDWRLEGDPQKGREVAEKALEKVKLVILISADEIKDPPNGVEVCTGEDKFNSDTIHRLICKRAKKGEGHANP